MKPIKAQTNTKADAQKVELERRLEIKKADQIGADFEAGQGLVDQGNIAVRACKEEAQSLAANSVHASTTAKGKCIVGKQFVVGFYDRDGPRKFDEAAFAAKYPDLYLKCTRMARVFDETLFTEQVQKKVVTKKMVKKFTVKGVPTRIAYVKRKDAKD